MMLGYFTLVYVDVFAGATFRVVGALLSVEQSTWHPEFGVSFENKMIVLDFQNPFCVVTVDFASAE